MIRFLQADNAWFSTRRFWDPSSSREANDYQSVEIITDIYIYIYVHVDMEKLKISLSIYIYLCVYRYRGHHPRLPISFTVVSPSAMHRQRVDEFDSLSCGSLGVQSPIWTWFSCCVKARLYSWRWCALRHLHMRSEGASYAISHWDILSVAR